MNPNQFAKFAWATLMVNFAVILWGAFVRATGSGPAAAAIGRSAMAKWCRVLRRWKR